MVSPQINPPASAPEGISSYAGKRIFLVTAHYSNEEIPSFVTEDYQEARLEKDRIERQGGLIPHALALLLPLATEFEFAAVYEFIDGRMVRPLDEDTDAEPSLHATHYDLGGES